MQGLASYLEGMSKPRCPALIVGSTISTVTSQTSDLVVKICAVMSFETLHWRYLDDSATKLVRNICQVFLIRNT